MGNSDFPDGKAPACRLPLAPRHTNQIVLPQRGEALGTQAKLQEQTSPDENNRQLPSPVSRSYVENVSSERLRRSSLKGARQRSKWLGQPPSDSIAEEPNPPIVGEAPQNPHGLESYPEHDGQYSQSVSFDQSSMANNRHGHPYTGERTYPQYPHGQYYPQGNYSNQVYGGNGSVHYPQPGFSNGNINTGHHFSGDFVQYPQAQPQALNAYGQPPVQTVYDSPTPQRRHVHFNDVLESPRHTGNYGNENITPQRRNQHGLSYGAQSYEGRAFGPHGGSSDFQSGLFSPKTRQPAASNLRNVINTSENRSSAQFTQPQSRNATPRATSDSKLKPDAREFVPGSRPMPQTPYNNKPGSSRIASSPAILTRPVPYTFSPGGPQGNFKNGNQGAQQSTTAQGNRGGSGNHALARNNSMRGCRESNGNRRVSNELGIRREPRPSSPDLLPRFEKHKAAIRSHRGARDDIEKVKERIRVGPYKHDDEYIDRKSRWDQVYGLPTLHKVTHLVYKTELPRVPEGPLAVSPRHTTRLTRVFGPVPPAFPQGTFLQRQRAKSVGRSSFNFRKIRLPRRAVTVHTMDFSLLEGSRESRMAQVAGFFAVAVEEAPPPEGSENQKKSTASGRSYPNRPRSSTAPINAIKYLSNFSANINRPRGLTHSTSLHDNRQKRRNSAVNQRPATVRNVFPGAIVVLRAERDLSDPAAPGDGYNPTWDGKVFSEFEKFKKHVGEHPTIAIVQMTKDTVLCLFCTSNSDQDVHKHSSFDIRCKYVPLDEAEHPNISPSLSTNQPRWMRNTFCSIRNAHVCPIHELAPLQRVTGQRRLNEPSIMQIMEIFLETIYSSDDYKMRNFYIKLGKHAFTTEFEAECLKKAFVVVEMRRRYIQIADAQIKRCWEIIAALENSPYAFITSEQMAIYFIVKHYAKQVNFTLGQPFVFLDEDCRSGSRRNYGPLDMTRCVLQQENTLVMRAQPFRWFGTNIQKRTQFVSMSNMTPEILKRIRDTDKLIWTKLEEIVAHSGQVIAAADVSVRHNAVGALTRYKTKEIRIAKEVASFFQLLYHHSALNGKPDLLTGTI